MVSAGASAGLSIRNKEDITKKSSKKETKPKCGTFLGHNHGRINVAGVHVISGFIFGYDVK